MVSQEYRDFLQHALRKGLITDYEAQEAASGLYDLKGFAAEIQLRNTYGHRPPSPYEQPMFRPGRPNPWGSEQIYSGSRRVKDWSGSPTKVLFLKLN